MQDDVLWQWLDASTCSATVPSGGSLRSTCAAAGLTLAQGANNPWARQHETPVDAASSILLSPPDASSASIVLRPPDGTAAAASASILLSSLGATAVTTAPTRKPR